MSARLLDATVGHLVARAVAFVEVAGVVALNCSHTGGELRFEHTFPVLGKLGSMTTPKSKLLGGTPGEAMSDGTISGASAGETPGSTATRQPVTSDGTGVNTTLDRTLLIERALLREHLLRIEFSQCDAIVTIESDQGHGRVWCVAGNAIDAEWQPRDTQATARGEEAVLQILTLREGDVSVAFVPVNRTRLIALSTRELLGRALRRTARPFAAPFAELEATGVRASVQPSQRTSSFYRQEPSGVFPNASPRSRAVPKVSLNTYLAGGVALLALATAVLGIRQLGSGAGSEVARNEQVQVGTLRASPTDEAVLLQVVPAEAEIWLDSKHIGTGSVTQGAIRDGLVHQLRFLAPGYAPKSLFFRDLPAPGTVTLEPMATSELKLKRAATAASTSLEHRPSVAPVPGRALQDARPPTSGAKHMEGLTSAQKTVVSESRRADHGDANPGSVNPGSVNAGGSDRGGIERGPEPKTAEARRQAAQSQRSTPVPQNKPPDPVKPQVQVIEVRTPRVQVID